MTYNPRIRNKKGNKLEVTGSILTGSTADFQILTGSVITGSSALFSSLTVDSVTVQTINITNTIESTASYALDADKLDGFSSTDFVKIADLSTVAVTSLSGASGIIVDNTSGSITASIDSTVVVTVDDTQTISGAKTFSSLLSGSSADFTSTVSALDLTVTNDVSINGLKVGHGSGNIITNTALGDQVLTVNSVGAQNTGVGEQALKLNESGSYNTAVGSTALLNNTNGNENTALGAFSLYSNTTGQNNTAVGSAALYSNIAASYNTAVGQTALFANTTGEKNTTIGHDSLKDNTSGSYNAALGSEALSSNLGGSNNTAVGEQALKFNTSGENNVAVGKSALLNSTTGSNNIAIGKDSGASLTGGSNNIFLGNEAGFGITDISNTLIVKLGENERLRINSEGNLGIGTTTPDHTLSVTGTLSVSSATTLTTVSGTTAEFTVVSASVISASTYVGIPAADVLAGGTNTFTGVNTFNINYITASVGITGSDAQFTTITASYISASVYAGIATTTQNNTFLGVNTFSNHYITASVGITGSDGKFTSLSASSVSFAENVLIYGTASLSANPEAAYLVYSSEKDKLIAFPGLYVSGALTASSHISGTTAHFNSITGTLAGDITGNAATVTNGIYTTNISSNATTAVVAGSGLIGGGTTGSLTLNVGQGNGIIVSGDDVAVNFGIVAGLTGSTFTGPISGTTAYFSGDITVNGTASIAQLNTLNQTSLVVGDKYITILSGGVDHTGIDGAGFLWGTSSGPGETTGSLGEHAHVLYDASLDALSIFPGLNVEGNTKLLSVSGTTAQFTVLTASTTSLVNANVSTLSVTTVTADTLTVAGLSTNVTGVNANFNLGTIGNKHIILVDAQSDITGTLPSAATLPYRQFIFKKTDASANVVAISASSGETIDGESKVEIFAQYETLTIVSDGVNKWFIV